jgi:hypothetical protein
MRVLAIAALLFGVGPALVGAGSEAFDKGPALPQGWRCGASGQGEAKWAVVKEASAPSRPQVLKQAGQADFPWCVHEGSELTDGFVEVRLHPVSGQEDQAGGVVFRFRSAGEYYIARANALEQNVAFFRMQNGERRLLKDVELEVKAGVWHHLRADFAGPRFTITFDGKRVLDVEDAQLTKAGAVGVWTKADSVTLFDDFAFGKRTADTLTRP